MNQQVSDIIEDCRADLERIFHLIEGLGSMAPASGYLTRFALIRISGTLEICYKKLIADYYESLSPALQRFITIHVRDASLNAKYENVCKVLKDFDEGKCTTFKATINARVDKDDLLHAMSDLNNARNDVAHGDSTSMTFNVMRQKFEKSVILLQELENVLV